MTRYVLAVALLAAAALAGPAQPPQPVPPPAGPPPAQTPPAAPAYTPPPAPPAPAASPPAATATPGDGVTVSMLNGTSTLKLFGQFSLLGVFSTTRPFPAGNPIFLFPRLDPANNTNTFDLHARQTSFGATFTGPEVLGLTPGGTFVAYIFNDNLVSDEYGFLPVTAYGELKNERWRFAGGLQSDVFNPAGPRLLTLVDMTFSGDSGSYRGQARLEHFYKPSDGFQLTTQVALSEPTTTIFTDNRRILEDNGWPNVEGRVAAGLGPVLDLAGGRKARPVEFGVSGVLGELRNAVLLPTPDTPPAQVRSVVLVWGVGADLRAAVTERFGLVGEAFIGQSLGEYNAMIGQSFGRDLRAIRGAGGFGEAYFYFTDKLHMHTGYGLDAPVVRDLAPAQIARNQTYYANLIWDASKTIQVSAAVQYRRTDYVVLPDADGMVFLTQFLWRF
jgi:hypothetical protein